MRVGYAEQERPKERRPRRSSGAGVSPRGSVIPRTDPKHVIEDDAPRSTDKKKSEARLCDILGIHCSVETPTEVYYQGWGQEWHQPEVIKCIWILTRKDTNLRSVDIKLDLTDSEDTVIIGVGFYSIQTLEIGRSHVICVLGDEATQIRVRC